MLLSLPSRIIPKTKKIKDGYYTTYDGLCLFGYLKHRRNNGFIFVSHISTTIRCFDDKCKLKSIKVSTDSVFNNEFTTLMFSEGAILEEALDLIRLVDPGVQKCDFSADMANIVASATDMLSNTIRDEIPLSAGQLFHRITDNDYSVHAMDDDKIVLVDKYQESRFYLYKMKNISYQKANDILILDGVNSTTSDISRL
ncbi:hypothetical protein RF11_10254 [Thelohanellus kitauei]|uniref:Uncharacterized protein n=1 Tax=Thelohanellus kitauei TaxID=669202 RepID=A0A0C2MXX6_THEKT|nr:hypothetical protein RF11_10254 [Thelohanellus kitauei]